MHGGLLIGEGRLKGGLLLKGPSQDLQRPGQALRREAHGHRYGWAARRRRYLG